MSSIIESYKNIYKKVENINAQIKNKNIEIERLTNEGENNYLARIENLEETLQKVDDYLLRVKGFQDLAKKSLDSTNLLTIEAPPGYRVNLNRLKTWSNLIDPTSSNDAYAQRVYAVAKCDECFLNKKKQEFEQKLFALKNDDVNSLNAGLSKLNKEIAELNDELKQFASSSDVSEFADEVISENEKYWRKVSPKSYPLDKPYESSFAPGAILLPFSINKEDKNKLKTQFGQFFDEIGNRVLIPFELPYSKEFVMTISCSNSRSKQLDRGIQNLILNFITNHEPGSNNIYVIDSARFNSNSLGALRTLEGTVALKQIPRNSEQLTNTLEGIVSYFSDIDDIIDLYDSIREYNENIKENTKKLPTTLMLLYGWPNSFSNADKELIRKMMMNYERYGLSFITVSFSSNEDDIKKLPATLPEYASNNAINIVMRSRETIISEPEKIPRNFAWYTFTEELNSDFINCVKDIKIEKTKKGNEYTTWFSLEKQDLPAYTREYKPIILPFGMDAKENIHEVSFENENFAAYLVGASRSGKSTLLHTLIAGIVRNYHPDNVELWLADFKQLEFKRYIDHCPPHVKYILLDESTELVYDLVDRLTNEMLERQKLFARLGVQRIDQVDVTKLDKPLPVIFVILDEFSIMSQAIAESSIYKLKLQNILAKGAALGMKFLFSSQSFSTGVSGLTPTARGQIQQRIAMKVKKEEISETLELSSNQKTEQVNNWMSALPPHYALIKHRVGDDEDAKLLVQRLLVLYFENYEVRDVMIDSIKTRMNKLTEYDTSDIRNYADKHPVLVDGNSFDKFKEDEFSINILNKDITIENDEMILSFGTPRLMSMSKNIILSNETRENIVLVSRDAELSCAASIILSTIKQCIIQSIKVEIWAYTKNKLYKNYKNIFENHGATIVEDIDDICASISKYKNIISEKQQDNVIVIMIGMDRICSDFEYVDTGSTCSTSVIRSVATKKFLENKGVIVTDENKTPLENFRRLLLNKKRELRADKTLNPEERDKIFSDYKLQQEKFFKQIEKNSDSDETSATSLNIVRNKEVLYENDIPNQRIATAYNASGDLTYIIKQGSRLGYHFMFCVNDFIDLKQSGLKLDFFRHRMAFQISTQDSRDIFNSKVASTLPEHICQYYNSLETYSFRPYLHLGIGWDGWSISTDGTIENPYTNNSEF